MVLSAVVGCQPVVLTGFSQWVQEHCPEVREAWVFCTEVGATHWMLKCPRMPDPKTEYRDLHGSC